MSDLTHLDDRTEVHINELRISGNEDWEICKEAITWEDAGENFTAAVLSFVDKSDANTVIGPPVGVAFSMITGVDIAYEDLEGEWQEEFNAGPSENPEHEDFEMGLDKDLPWSDPELIHQWWSKNKNNFQNGTKYLCGKPIS